MLLTAVLLAAAAAATAHSVAAADCSTPRHPNLKQFDKEGSSHHLQRGSPCDPQRVPDCENTGGQLPWDVFINVCDQAKPPADYQGDSSNCADGDTLACQSWGVDVDSSASLGSVSQATYKDEENGDVTVTAPGGTEDRNLVLVLHCDDMASDPAPVLDGEDQTKKLYHFMWKNKQFCEGGPGPGGGGLSPGSILLLIVFIFAIVFFVVGAIVQKFVRGQEGLDIIPFSAVIMDFPVLVKDGIMFVINKARGRSDYTPV